MTIEHGLVLLPRDTVKLLPLSPSSTGALIGAYYEAMDFGDSAIKPEDILTSLINDLIINEALRRFTHPDRLRSVTRSLRNNMKGLQIEPYLTHDSIEALVGANHYAISKGRETISPVSLFRGLLSLPEDSASRTALTICEITPDNADRLFGVLQTNNSAFAA